MNISSETEGSTPKAVASELLKLGAFCGSNEDEVIAIFVTDSRRRFAIEITGNEYEFYVDYPGDEEVTPAKIAAEDMEEAIEITGRIIDRLLALSLNIVTINVIGDDEEYSILYEATFKSQDQLPTSEAAGYQDLMNIFVALPVCGCACEDEPDYNEMQPGDPQWVDHDRVLAILQKYPNLANRTLEFEDYLIVDQEEEECRAVGSIFDDALPLSCMLLAPNASSLEVVEAVYELNNEAVTIYQGNRDFTALQFALLRKPCNELVEFIFSKNPSELCPRCVQPNSPLGLVLTGISNGMTEFSTLVLLFDLNPDIVHSCCLVSRAMQLQCPQETLRFLTVRCVTDDEHYLLPTIGRRDIETIRDVLPQVTTLRVTAHEGWLSGSLEMLLSSVARGPSTVTNLALDGIPPSPMVGKLLKLVLEKDSTLRKLIVNFDDEMVDNGIIGDMELTMNRILAGLCANRTLKTIGLGGIFSGSWDGIVSGEYSLDRISNSTATSSLESVSLSLYPNEAFLSGMLSLFPTVTTVSLRVRVNEEGYQDLTEFLGSLRFLQQRHPKLNQMNLRLPRVPHLDDVHIEAVCDLLRQNRLLVGLLLGDLPEDKVPKVETKLIEMLKETNDTLTELSVHRHNPTLQYFVALNGYGRKIARDNHTSKEAFVELLCKVIDSHEMCFGAKHMIQYGLLHEKPGLWAN